MSLRAMAGLTVGMFLALGASTSAHAVTLNPANSIVDPNLFNDVADGPTYRMSDSPYVWGAVFQSADSAGSAVLLFENHTTGTAILTLAIGTVLQGFGGFFTGGVTASWAGAESVFIPEGDAENGTFEISHILASKQIAALRIDFGDPVSFGESAPGIQLQVGTIVGNDSPPPPPEVPLPSTAILLLSSLAGLVLARASGASRHDLG